MKSLLVISRHLPTQPQAREALDSVFAAAAFDIPCAILFAGDGVLQLLKGQDAAQIGQKSLAANLQALPLYGIEDLLVCQHSLDERGLQASQCLLNARIIDNLEMARLIQHYDQVLSL